MITLARWKACELGRRQIEPEHVLFAIHYGDGDLIRQCLPNRAVLRKIRERIELRAVRGARISWAVDLPLSEDFKRLMDFAAREAGDQHEITTPHLLLGLLSLENCFATELLRQYGLSLASARQALVFGLLPHSISQLGQSEFWRRSRGDLG
jgi:ATP-dependent Clp protease ATP-binding subunit ClpA